MSIKKNKNGVTIENAECLGSHKSNAKCFCNLINCNQSWYLKVPKSVTQATHPDTEGAKHWVCIIPC